MKVLDLFSGIGGFSLGLERAGMETVAFCEIEPFCRKVLAKHWPDVPIYKDVRELTNERLKADGIFPDVITGGFPCQDISVAGNQKGIEGERSGLWSELARIIGEVQPRYAILENVTALTSGDSGRWFGRVLGDLAEIGYDCEWHCIPASELGAHHHRDRVWIIAYPRHAEPQGRDTTSADNDRCSKERIPQGSKFASPCGNVADTPGGIESSGLNGSKSKGSETAAPEGTERTSGRSSIETMADSEWRESKLGRLYARTWREQKLDERVPGTIWKTEPHMGRVVDGLPDTMDRLKGLGNAVCPQIPELIGRAIMEAENG